MLGAVEDWEQVRGLWAEADDATADELTGPEGSP